MLHPWILESLPQKENNSKLPINKLAKIRCVNMKTSNFISYQKQTNKVQFRNETNKNGTTTKNTSINTEKYSSPVMNII